MLSLVSLLFLQGTTSELKTIADIDSVCLVDGKQVESVLRVSSLTVSEAGGRTRLAVLSLLCRNELLGWRRLNRSSAVGLVNFIQKYGERKANGEAIYVRYDNGSGFAAFYREIDSMLTLNWGKAVGLDLDGGELLARALRAVSGNSTVRPSRVAAQNVGKEDTHLLPGSVSRKRILDALREPVQRRVGRPVVFVVDLLESDGNAVIFMGRMVDRRGKSVNDRRTGSSTVSARLQKVGSKWRVLSVSYGD